MKPIDGISGGVVDAAIGIHRELGQGLRESVYATVLAASLHRRGYKVARHVPVDIEYDGMRFPAAFQIDERLTYLRLTKQPVGLLLDFSCETMRREFAGW